MASMGDMPNIAGDKMSIGPRHQKNKKGRGLLRFTCISSLSSTGYLWRVFSSK